MPGTNSKLRLLGSKEGKESRQLAWRKILSDVDDTLLCSGGNYPAGVDKSYPHKAIYPGVLSFYRELDLGIEGEDSWDADRTGNLVFLSARPHIYKDLSESRTFLKFQQIEGLRARPALLSGNLGSGTKYLLNDDTKALAMTKYQSYKEYISLYPEYKSVFIGDNGQGDVMAAELMFKDKELRSAAGDVSLSRAYMHIVRPLHQTSVEDTSCRRPHRVEHQICYFSTYIDAAIDAYQHRLIRLTGLRRIMEDAVKDFTKISKDRWLSTSKESADSKRELQIRELNRSIEIGNRILVKHGLAVVNKLLFRQVWSRGQVVKTAYGYGIIQGHRHVDGIYTVALPWDRTGKLPPVMGYFPLSALQRISEKVPLAVTIIPSDSINMQSNTANNASSLLSFSRYASLGRTSRDSTPSSSFSLPKPFNRSAATTTAGAELQRQNSLERVLFSQPAVATSSSSPMMDLSTSSTRSSPSDSSAASRLQSTAPLMMSGSSNRSGMSLPYTIELDRITGRKHLTNGNGSSANSSSSSLMIMSTPPRQPDSMLTAAPSPAPLTATTTNTNGRPRADSISFKPLLLGVAGSVSANSTAASAESKIQQQVNTNIVGSIAWTPYGRAYILEYRAKEAIIVVRYLDWKAFGFLRKEALVVMTEAGLTTHRQEQLRLEREFQSREWERKLESEVIQIITPTHSDNRLQTLLDGSK
jgi:hypothetical protein